MDYSGIIKRSWQITWQYKALWILGIFAGVSGCSGGSGGGSGGSGGSSGGGSGSTPFPDVSGGDVERMVDSLTGYLPLIIGITVLLLFVSIVWTVFQVAARGGLVSGVNAIEEGSPRTLGELWRAGFARFWTLVGLDIILKLPLTAGALLLMVLIFVPIIGTLAAGGEPGAEILAPLCGTVAIGVPVMLVASFILGLMHLIALRYVMLGGQGAFEAAGNSWRFLRARVKDSVIMWFINAGLNIAASFVLAIPAVAVGVAIAVPMVAGAATDNWETVLAAIPVAIVLFAILGLAYNAVWGTYTSSLWTLWFRDVAGMNKPIPEAVISQPQPQPQPTAQESPYAPAPQPPAAG